jgi:hypothetical protein
MINRYYLNVVRTSKFNFRSSCALGIISLFVLFLAASAPHRVHHLLEGLHLPEDQDQRSLATSQSATVAHDDAHRGNDQPDDTEHTDTSQRDQHHDGAPKTDCVLQSAASTSHLSPSSPFALPYREIALATPVCKKAAGIANFDPSPRSQRAPPSF